MQGIYTYIPETNYVPREYSVAAILLLLFMVLISLVPVLNLLFIIIIMIIIFIIIIITLVITSTQCIYNYVPETNHVSTVHSVAAVLYLQFMVQYLHVMLFPMLNTFCTVLYISAFGCINIRISALMFQLLIQERRR